MALLEIKNLSVGFDTSSGQFMAVQGIDLHVDAREVLAIVGESGSGKSVAMLAVMGLLPNTATVTADKMVFNGHDMLTGTHGKPQSVLHGWLPAGRSSAFPYENGCQDPAHAGD